MAYLCPVCSSAAVEPAGSTDLYLSLICRQCQAWSTVPLPARRPSTPAATDKPSRQG